MSDQLVILRENAPQMSMCAICPKPGACCNGFSLNLGPDNGWFDSSNWEEQANFQLALRGLPFKVTGAFIRRDDSWTTPVYGCPELLSDGRCGIYATRPFTCRVYAPGEDRLCIMTEAMNASTTGQ